MALRAASALAVLLLVAPSPDALAQLNTGGSESHFGSARLASGFEPDPKVVEVTSGGGVHVNAMRIGSDCTGYAAEDPDFILHVTSRMDMLRLYVEAPSDTGLVINDPDGKWHCNDDSSGHNPMVSIRRAGTGQYDVWVSSYEEDSEVEGRLFITEREQGPGAGGGGHGGSGGSSLETGADTATYGSVHLSAGFPTDPRTVGITSGGGIHVNPLNLGNDCVGYATRKPDYILHLDTVITDLRIFVRAPKDTALVINDPSENWRCNDDAKGRNPSVSFPRAETGQYDIWITSLSEDEGVDGTLGITER